MARLSLVRSSVAVAAWMCGALPGALGQAASASQAASAPAAASAALPGASAPTAEEAALKARFADWVAAFRTYAQAAGIGEATLRAAFDDVQYLPRVVELDRTQPEFVRPVWDYLDTAVSATRVARGQEKLQQVREAADRAAARHGVPAAVLIAIWGIESNYGDHTGNTPTIDALATLGFDGRREAWAKGQLMAALKILQSGDIDRSRMIGSWAGAMGQTQFLPSNYLAYAVDADGDGRRDLWGSADDVLASTANFLARVGWRSGEPWGGEVRLPADFDVGRADPQTRQSSAQWAADGVRAANGGRLPDLAEAGILQPAGARGPAFLVGPNFRAILRYNNATSYALAVHLLAQRIAGGPAVQAAWPRDLQLLTRTQIESLQTALQARGFDAGTPDGILGPATRDALRRWQKQVGLPADGFPTLDLLQRLRNP
jgi:lytic murein transglycosylase